MQSSRPEPSPSASQTAPRASLCLPRIVARARTCAPRRRHRARGFRRGRDPVPTLTALTFATAFVLLRRGLVILLFGAGLSTWVERIMHGAGLEASIGPGQGP